MEARVTASWVLRSATGIFRAPSFLAAVFPILLLCPLRLVLP